MKKIPAALQLWSIRDDVARDFAGTMTEVARMGYAGVELAGYGNTDAAGAKAALDRAGLVVAGQHIGYAALAGNLTQVVSEALLLGNRHIIVPWWNPAQFVSAAACEQIGASLDALGAQLRAFGLQLHYHNHAAELKLLEGRTVFEWILGAAQPRNLGAEVDLYWVHVGGLNPAHFLRQLGGRARLLHLKDEKELGRGPVNYPEVLAAADTIGAVEWQIVEQEAYSYAPMESVRLDFEQLRTWGRA